MATRTPRLKMITVNLAAGATKKFPDNEIGVQRAIFIPKGIMEQNPTFIFGSGDPWTPNMTTGLFIQFDEDFDELTISVPSGAAGNAVGVIVMSRCRNFLMQAV